MSEQSRRYKEPKESVICFEELGVEEYMWDWEGKHADEAVIDKLFSEYYDYFRKHRLGKEKFLTFRLPNVWQEKGYSLIRALMVVLTSEDFARDLGFGARPLFEVILPMTERAQQLMYIQKSFQELARFKMKVFAHRKRKNTDYIELIPLIEGVEDQVHIRKLLSEYVKLHRKFFHREPAYLRPFLARSDPALLSGFVSNVLANKVALSEIYRFEKERGVPMYPIIGAGSLIFRGGLSPARVRTFISEYGGVRTVTVQSAFRYDYDKGHVKKALQYLHREVPKSPVQRIAKEDMAALQRVIKIFSRSYQSTLGTLIKDMEPFFRAVPKRRERRQHIGLLAYGREMGKSALPRAISFAAAFYSIGVPPEFIGLGRALASLKEREKNLLLKYYKHFESDVKEAGRFLNHDNIALLTQNNRAWSNVTKDIELVEKSLRIALGPKSTDELLHRNLTSQLFLQRKNAEAVRRLIAETGKLRRSLG